MIYHRLMQMQFLEPGSNSINKKIHKIHQLISMANQSHKERIKNYYLWVVREKHPHQTEWRIQH